MYGPEALTLQQKIADRLEFAAALGRITPTREDLSQLYWLEASKHWLRREIW